MIFNKRIVFIVLVYGLVVSGAAAGRLPKVKPEKVGMSTSVLKRLDGLILQAMGQGDFPGAVLVVGRKGKIVYRNSFGDAQRIPLKRPMRTDMIFDLASLTKPVATAASIMILVERGRLRLSDRIQDFFPDWIPFKIENKIENDEEPDTEVCLWHLLTHTSGLPPFLETEDVIAACGDPIDPARFAALIAGLEKLSPPGESFVYSDLGFILLAYLIEQSTGKNVWEFSKDNIFTPLRMQKTFFNPPQPYRSLCVTTEVLEEGPLTGIVHDPRARLMGGVAGHAGLFSTADDLSVYAQMLLNGGEFKGKRILSPLGVERMTEIFRKSPDSGRGLGWDLASPYSSSGGDLFGAASYGHTGYTGTSVWIDPETEIFVIFLTNRVHPDDSGSVAAWRGKIANVAAAAVLKKD